MPEQFPTKRDEQPPPPTPEEFGLTAETTPLMGDDREAAEQVRYAHGSLMYGALPHFDERTKHFAEEADYFAAMLDDAATPKLRQQRAEGILVHEAKFGERLSAFAERILAQYPPLPERAAAHKGAVIALFGLPGSGKSSVLEANKTRFGDAVVVIDNDAARYHLFGPLVRDVETAHGATLDDVRTGGLMHNKITNAFYLLLDQVTAELKRRGYIVIRSSIVPAEQVDATVYVEHPADIDLTRVRDEDVRGAAKRMLRSSGMSKRTAPDTFDWTRTEPALDFRTMRTVEVKIPPAMYPRLLKETRTALTKYSDRVHRIANPQTHDRLARREQFIRQMQSVFAAVERY